MARRELDRWAKTLGVTNDADAIRELDRLIESMLHAAAVAGHLARWTADAPDPDAPMGAREAATHLLALVEAMTTVRRRFAVHERGGH